MRTYAPRSRKGNIEQANANAISTRIKTLPTIKEKQELVGNSNAYLFVFGRNLKAVHPYHPYGESND
jgi:hypothetical protein